MITYIRLTIEQTTLYPFYSSVTCYWWFLILGTFEMFLYKFWCDTDDMLTFPVLDHVQRL